MILNHVFDDLVHIKIVRPENQSRLFRAIDSLCHHCRTRKKTNELNEEVCDERKGPTEQNKQRQGRSHMLVFFIFLHVSLGVMVGDNEKSTSCLPFDNLNLQWTHTDLEDTFFFASHHLFTLANIDIYFFFCQPPETRKLERLLEGRGTRQ